MRKIIFYCLLLGLASVGCRTQQKEWPRPSGFEVQPAAPQGVPMQPPPGAPPGILAQPQPLTVWVRGNVKNPIIGWTEDLTLAQALVAAEYRGIMDPHSIVLLRQGEAMVIDTRKLLRGKENPILQPGDIIELRH